MSAPASNDPRAIAAAALPTLGVAAAAVAVAAPGASPWWALLVAAAAAAACGVHAVRRSQREKEPLANAVLELAERPDAIEAAANFSRLGDAGRALKTIARRQSQLQHSLQLFAMHLDKLPAEIGKVNDAIRSRGDGIEEVVEETASLLAHINESIRGITSEVDSLSRSADEASTAILQMGSSIDEVARSAGALHDSANTTTSSVHEMGASIRQVAESADSVQSMAEESAAAMIQMDRAIQEVSKHVTEASQLTDAVSHGADDGSRAVEATIDGIEQIRAQTEKAREVLARLATRISEIGEIVNVIGGINEETNLLSLNAAIIAAQAGEQGKAFAVVANHVKTLAQRTGSSTKEIAALINAVQEESANAVAAMEAGMGAVGAGVQRSRLAGEALEAIRESSREASARVSEIARATEEQTRNSKHVAEAAQRTSSMVQQITTAMGEQSRASETMLRNAETALELCRQVHRATEEQRESSRFVTASIGAITEMIKSIQSNTESHGAASESVSEAVTRILDIAKSGGEGLRELMGELVGLQSEVRNLVASQSAAQDGVSPRSPSTRR